MDLTAAKKAFDEKHYPEQYFSTFCKYLEIYEDDDQYEYSMVKACLEEYIRRINEGYSEDLAFFIGDRYSGNQIIDEVELFSEGYRDYNDLVLYAGKELADLYQSLGSSGVDFKEFIPKEATTGEYGLMQELVEEQHQWSDRVTPLQVLGRYFSRQFEVGETLDDHYQFGVFFEETFLHGKTTRQALNEAEAELDKIIDSEYEAGEKEEAKLRKEQEESETLDLPMDGPVDLHNPFDAD